MHSRPKVLIAVDEEMFSTIFSQKDIERLHSFAEVLNPLPPKRADQRFLLDHISPAQIVISSWGTDALGHEIMERAESLALVCHAAGSIRPIVSDALWNKGVRITSGAAAIAYGVAEFCLGLMLTASKRVFWQAQATNRGLWTEASKCFGGGFEIYQQNIGIIGAGHIGRRLIELLQTSFTCNLFVYDPFLSAGKATELGAVKLETLDELFATCRVVSLNAPTNEGTRHMLRGRHFAALQPGSVFINSAGSIQIHEEEFIAELRKGRFVACIDRCEEEPVQLDHPYRHFPNVLLTPHIAGVMAENRLRIGTFAVNEVAQYINKGELIHEVTREALARMA